MVIKSKVSKLEKKVLLVDIGGTNIRTATSEIGSFVLQNANKQNIDCLDSFDEIIENLLNEDMDIKHIVFSIAGPKLHQSISMTNRQFEIDESDILNKFKIDSCHILNDWESIGHGLSLFVFLGFFCSFFTHFRIGTSTHTLCGMRSNWNRCYTT